MRVWLVAAVIVLATVSFVRAGFGFGGFRVLRIEVKSCDLADLAAIHAARDKSCARDLDTTIVDLPGRASPIYLENCIEDPASLLNELLADNELLVLQARVTECLQSDLDTSEVEISESGEWTVITRTFRFEECTGEDDVGVVRYLTSDTSLCNADPDESHLVLVKTMGCDLGFKRLDCLLSAPIVSREVRKYSRDESGAEVTLYGDLGDREWVHVERIPRRRQEAAGEGGS